MVSFKNNKTTKRMLENNIVQRIHTRIIKIDSNAHITT